MENLVPQTSLTPPPATAWRNPMQPDGPEILSPLGLPFDTPYSAMPDPATGNLKIDPDISLKSKKFNLDINFYYSAGTQATNEFGFHRNCSTKQFIATANVADVTLVRGDFTQYRFNEFNFGGNFITYASATAGCNTTLSLNTLTK